MEPWDQEKGQHQYIKPGRLGCVVWVYSKINRKATHQMHTTTGLGLAEAQSSIQASPMQGTEAQVREPSSAASRG